jgi:alkylated DNA repair dioxygenase AlkB
LSIAPDDPGSLLDLPGAQLRWWPRFLSGDDAERLLRELQHELPWQQQSIQMFGRAIPEPRLVSWHGDPAARYRYSGRDNLPAPWTATLAWLRSRIEARTGAHFNSVLANLYRDGSDHIGWHADDEPELGPEPVIASLSLGATRSMQFRARSSSRIALRIALEPGSLLLMAGGTQRSYHHRIPKTSRPVGTRVNLTFRMVTPVPGADTLSL